MPLASTDTKSVPKKQMKGTRAAERAIVTMRVIVWCLAAAFLFSTTSVPVGAADDAQSLLRARTVAPGVAIVVARIARDGTIAFQEAGTLASGQPANEHTLFEIGSVTKTFTATILAAMVLDGSVNLADPVQKYLPASVHVPMRGGKAITLLDLADQHSGLPRMPDNWHPRDFEDPYVDYGIAQLYAYLNNASLARDPGSQFEYSNLGLGLLGTALANRAGTSYAALLRKRVLDPLGMRETTIALDPAQRARFAAGHTADGDLAKPWNFAAFAGAGAIRSTAADMAKYARCGLGQGQLAHACLFAQKPRTSFPGNKIGLVWWTDDLTHVTHHGGDTKGYHASVAFAPDRSRGIVVLTNGGLSVDDIATHLIDPSVAVATIPPATAPLDGAKLNQYVGVFALHEGSTSIPFTFARVGDHLTAQLEGQPALRIFPTTTTDRFELHDVAASLDFMRDPTGNVIAVTLHQNGQNVVASLPGVPIPSPVSLTSSYPPVIALDAATFDSYVGTYAGSGLHFTVIRAPDGILVQLSGQAMYPVFASAKDAFYYKIADAQIAFERSTDGTVSALVLHQNGNITRALRQTVKN